MSAPRLRAYRLRTAVPVLATRSFRAIGTTATVVVTEAAAAERARVLLAEELRDLDHACSRFRDDAELARVERESDGRPVPVSPLLFTALEVACAVAARTAGVVDPTVGSALVDLGYDRDFDALQPDRPAGRPPCPAPGWWQLGLDPESRSVSIPRGVHVDLGATAKALAADRAAARIVAATGGGALVNLGGDVGAAGEAPPGGWVIGIADHHRTDPGDADAAVSVSSGGVASSGTTARTWCRGGRRLHHIVDPWTGQPAEPVWSLVTTVAPSCVEANAFSTAAVVWGADAPGNLHAHGIAARLVAADGTVCTAGDWPAGSERRAVTGEVAPCWR